MWPIGSLKSFSWCLLSTHNSTFLHETTLTFSKQGDKPWCRNHNHSHHHPVQNIMFCSNHSLTFFPWQAGYSSSVPTFPYSVLPLSPFVQNIKYIEPIFTNFHINLAMYLFCYFLSHCVCAYVCEHVSVVTCFPWCTHGGHRTIFGVSPCLPPHLRQSLFSTLYPKLSGPWATGDALASNSRLTRSIIVFSFMWVLGIRTQALLFAGQVLYPVCLVLKPFPICISMCYCHSERHINSWVSTNSLLKAYPSQVLSATLQCCWEDAMELQPRLPVSQPQDS